MFFSEEKLHLSKKQLEEFTACAQTSAQALQNILVSKSAFFDKTGGIFKANPGSSNFPGMGRGDISQHIPIPSEARTAGPATSHALKLVTLGAIPLPFGKWGLCKIWNLENGLDASPGTLLAGHYKYCTDTYIYICLFMFLGHTFAVAMPVVRLSLCVWCQTIWLFL